MSNWVRAWWPCLVVWFIVAAIYLVGAVRQRNTLNLSATAGGQYPYLVYAQGMATEGWWGHFGDRNRMPFYPALLSFVFDENWDEFVARSSWFAIGSSLTALAVIGVGAYAALPRLHATLLITVAAISIFSKYASFVQAELLYYALFFVSWLMLCKLLKKLSVRWGAIAGATLGLCYLTKASALPLIAAFVFVLIVHQFFYLFVRKHAPDFNTSRGFAALATLLVCFFVVCGPYLKSNYERFGKLFYNVNSTFFMWCDSWAEAEAFASRYKVDQRYPETSASEIPSPLRYWRTHSGDQILRRLQYGIETITRLLWREGSTKYMALIASLCIALCIIHRFRLRELLEGERWGTAFTFLVILGYEFVYVWYAQVAYGERFVLSLILPCIFGALWILKEVELKVAERFPQSKSGRICAISLPFILGLTIVEGIVWAGVEPKPDSTFTVFYFNESRAREMAGDVREASKGYAGVLQLDPGFAAAHQSLGMIALRAGDVDEAIQCLTRAVELLPNSADARNSLGSALAQAGRINEAIHEFEKAVAIDPKLAVAWFNLGGSYWTVGELDNARRVLANLRSLDGRLASQLEKMINEGK